MKKIILIAAIALLVGCSDNEVGVEVNGLTSEMRVLNSDGKVLHEYSVDLLGSMPATTTAKRNKKDTLWIELDWDIDYVSIERDTESGLVTSEDKPVSDGMVITID